MTVYEKHLEVDEQEAALFEPVGKDSEIRENVSAEEMENMFASLIDEPISWSYGAAATTPWYDRYFTVEFDDDHVFDICWTYVGSGEDGQPDGGYWYLGGVRFGTADDMLLDLGESSDDCGLASAPDDSLSGDYEYEVDGDTYIIHI